MKRFEIYRNVRKRAMIMGLPISWFALMMTSIIGSLLMVIFSFSFIIIIALVVFNVVLYMTLTYIIRNPSMLHINSVFPATISTKKQSGLYYEEN